MAENSDKPIPLWLDCDPGHDDATAILLAGHSPRLRLLGVSAIGGNQTLDKVTHNALDVLDAIGLSHIDVVAGQARPLMRAPKLCPEIHGDSGLDGPGGGRLLPRSPRRPLPGRAVNVMFGAIRAAAVEEGFGEGGQEPGEEGAAAEGPRRRERVRLVCTGALTNAALLLTIYPEVIDWVEVVIMGGAMGVGNTGPVMEFNIQTDPEAAKIVFESGVPLTMVPLEAGAGGGAGGGVQGGCAATHGPRGSTAPAVTHTVLATPEVLAAIGSGATALDPGPPHHPASGAPGPGLHGPSPAAPEPLPASPAPPPPPPAASPFRSAVQQLLLFFAATYRRVFHFQHPPLHDPVAVAYVLAPALFTARAMRVDVEVASPLSAGQTVCDVWGQAQAPPNATVALRVEAEGFWGLLLEAIARADAVSPLNAAAGAGKAVGEEGQAVGEAGEVGQAVGV
ncbi:hypothetical protein HYH03_016133 [Edaphochlamys debaryana]|uniref:Inosine/uridine-preferring nucleoside hydrolase domain-containing protein n=1 Tax=Edaphochlamys debaryana TaxID=47281 RepID=A0A835XI66_9CHLO|nr:hypothetical protein HYH03_016133 [Edaphochlamys debaryana]|eukprot:KAG2485147.1 hypothetical protein HYH03_016133 [Edaphochlamys debaryana]